MKPIPTTYKGVQFRSKLEAKWAVFFDSMRIKWRYEPFSFNIGRVSYTPDFLLYNVDFRHKKNIMPGLGNTEGTLVEVKPIQPNEDYKNKLYSIADQIGSPIILAIGSPEERELEEFSPKLMWDGPMVFIQCSCGYTTIEYDEGSYGYCNKCKGNSRLISEGVINQLANRATYHRFDLL